MVLVMLVYKAIMALVTVIAAVAGAALYGVVEAIRIVLGRPTR